jgi:flagella basal body P-ring formation protein FlgA
MTPLIPLFFTAMVAGGGCQSIETESVLARDVAAVLPAFAQVPAEFLIGYVPASGAQRIFHAEELERIARNRNIDLHGLEDVCFTRRLFVPDASAIRESMQKALDIPAAKIDILASSRQAVPFGEVVFPRSGVQGAGPEITWLGYVRGNENTRFPVWARARITAPVPRVVANADLQAGKPIESSQVRIELSEDSPFEQISARSVDDVVGLVPKSTIPRSIPIRKSQIEQPMDVARGSMVRVDVFEGAAHITAEAQAETAGMKGSFVTVRNISSGREFRAEVTGKGQVTVGVHE